MFGYGKNHSYKAGQSGNTNVFVGNLAADTTQNTLRMAFATYGIVESCFVTTKEGKTNGFVNMSNAKSAQQAITALSGFCGWEVQSSSKGFSGGGGWSNSGSSAWGSIGGWGNSSGWGGGWGGSGGSKWVSRRDEPEKPEPPPNTSLYVRFLPAGTSESDVKAFFTERAMKVEEVRMVPYRHALECAALVRLSTLTDAEAARAELDEKIVDVGLPLLQVTKQQKNGVEVPDHVYVKGVPINTTKDKITDFIGLFGQVLWCAVLNPKPSGDWWLGNDRNQKVGPSGSALVQLASQEEAETVIEKVNGHPSPASLLLPVRVRYAEFKK